MVNEWVVTLRAVAHDSTAPGVAAYISEQNRRVANRPAEGQPAFIARFALRMMCIDLGVRVRSARSCILTACQVHFEAMKSRKCYREPRVPGGPEFQIPTSVVWMQAEVFHWLMTKAVRT